MEVWFDFSEAGLGLNEIAKARGLSYGKVRSMLVQYEDYAALASVRRQQAPAAARKAAMKRIDVEEALALLKAGQGTRSVASHFGVCTRTLRKRLLPYPEYSEIMRKRRRDVEQGKTNSTSC